MQFAWTADQLALRDAVRALLAAECPIEVTRAAWDGDLAPARRVWSALAENGVLGIAAPKSAGGLGLGAGELVLALEECGRFAVPGPVVETAVGATVLGGDTFAGVISGSLVATADIGAGHAPWAQQADLIIAERDGQLFEVPADAARVEPARSVDRTRHLGAVSFSADADGVVALGESTVARRWGTLAASAVLVGLSSALLDAAVEYASVRTQFGRAIGSFQAVQHRLADARVSVEFARPPVYRAAWSVDNDDPDVDVHVAMAKVVASEASESIAAAALQVHGAIGYSTELDLHLFMKRAWAFARAYGTATEHRATLIRRVVHGESA